MENTQDLFINQAALAAIYEPKTILINLVLAFALGILISYVYKVTHKGLSYSQSFMLTTVFVTLIVAMVIMVIGNNIARAFALVGALSIIRFRTVIKDTKDTAYVFLGLAAGMAAGTSSYFLAICGSTIILAVAVLLHLTNYGSLYKTEFLLIFRVITNCEESRYIGAFNKYAKRSSLLHIEPSGDQKTTKLTFDILMNKNKDPKDFSEDIANIEGISEVVMVASKTDKDY